MSREQDYLPPVGTELKWQAKRLAYSEWSCDLGKQLVIYDIWPAQFTGYVDKTYEGKYRWILHVIDFYHTRTEKKGIVSDPLSACLKVEHEGKRAIKKVIPRWVEKALENGWKPPQGFNGLFP